MKIGIMQPYFFPYISYWQLIHSVDLYLVYDDVNYIKGGWINRNQILLNQKRHYFGIRLCHATPNKLINEIKLLDDPIYRRKMISTLENAYKKAPLFNQCMPLLESILLTEESSLAMFLFNQIKKVCEYLHIHTPLILTSQIETDHSLKGQEKIIHICKAVGANAYHNPIGGQELYQKETFADNSIKLNFIKTYPIQYRQYNQNDFVDNLSIIDVMMNLTVKEISNLLKGYCLI